LNVHALEAQYGAALAAVSHAVFVLGGLLLYVITTRAGRQRRHPSAALAWVLTIVLLPYVAVPLFLVLGSRKLAKRAVAAPLPIPAGGPAPQWAGAMLAGQGLGPPSGNASVRFHADGAAALTALMEIIDAAEHSIRLATFILADDQAGNAVADALVRRARAGIAVSVLLEPLSRLSCSRRQLDRLRAAGVHVRWANAGRHDRIETRLNLRYHRKLVVCDGAVLWSGGRNLADEYFTHDASGAPWVDLSYDVRGPLAVDAGAMFARDWRQSGALVPEALPALPATVPSGAVPAQLVASGPEYADENYYGVLLAGAFQARERIVAVTPYFVPDDALLVAWRMACRRGVRITLVVPRRSNHRLADWARGRALRDLAAAGAEIHLFPRMIHAKAIVIDDAIALCGSANLDSRSLFLNFEMMVAFYGAAEIGWLAQWIAARAAESAPYTIREPSLPVDLAEGVVRVVGFQL
jgi:cardiolipin synthase